jgi:hypothetical protein
MYGIRRMAITVMLGIGIGGSSIPIATAAFAAPGTTFTGPASSAGTGAFATWQAAQKAAGFGLVKPTQTYHLARNGKISVMRCYRTRKHPKSIVEATYGNLAKGLLGISQNNSGGRCGRSAKAKTLGRYQIGGVVATLVGFCGGHQQPFCQSRRVELSLTWRRNGVSYQAVSFNQWRATIVNFARKLTPVG